MSILIRKTKGWKKITFSTVPALVHWLFILVFVSVYGCVCVLCVCMHGGRTCASTFTLSLWSYHTKGEPGSMLKDWWPIRFWVH